MEKIQISNDLLKDYKLDLSDGAESSRLHNNEIMIKIIKKHFLQDDRQIIIENLHNFDHENIVIPIQSIYDKNRFIGYTMKYLKGYQTFDKYLDNKTSFNQRKELLLKLASVFDYFDEKKFSYHDIHNKNILYKDDDIKLIDLDGGVLKNFVNDNINYETSIRAEKKSLSRFLLSKLYGINEGKLLNLNKNDIKLLLSMLPDSIKELYDYAINDDYYVFNNITSSFENINEEVYDDTKIILKKGLY